MSWNYRVCKKTFDKYDPSLHSPEDKYSVGIYEVYYNDNGDICLVSCNPIDPYGPTFEGLQQDFKLMQEAFDKPVLDLDTLEFAPVDDEIDDTD